MSRSRLLAIFATLSFVMLISLSAYAQGGAQLSCAEIFKQYAGDKDFMSESDFQQYWDASGHRQQATTGNAPVGGADTAFYQVNKSNNGKITKEEFCHWLRTSPEAER